MPKIFGNETQKTISDWALASFGDVKTTRSILTRAGCELAELAHAIECDAPREKIASEIADVIIVLCRYPVEIALAHDTYVYTFVGSPRYLLDVCEEALSCAIRYEDSKGKASVLQIVAALFALKRVTGVYLHRAIDEKMVINRGQKWAAKGTGHGQHVPESAPQRSAHEYRVLAFVAEYKTACASIAPARAATLVGGPDDHERRKEYCASLTRAGNARRALLAYVSGDAPEVGQ